MKPLRFAVFGAGFWAHYQTAAWREIPGVQCAAICDPNIERARALALENGLPESSAYRDPQQMLHESKPDFVDIITDVNSHVSLAMLCREHRIASICQKPMAPSMPEAEELVRAFAESKVPLFIHENWRWQTPIRELKKVLDSGEIGQVFRAGVDMISGFPVFQNQPFLAELPQFILTDLGSHLFDTARFLFGEASSLHCHTGRVHSIIKGEDHATALLTMGETGIPVVVRMAYAENFLRQECFPQTLFFVEGSKGSVELLPDYQLVITTESGTRTVAVPPSFYSWADPRYAVVHSSVVPCNIDLLKGLRGGKSETSGAENLETVKLVYGAYTSASTNNVWKPDKKNSDKMNPTGVNPERHVATLHW